jgi:uncharacterized protein YecE (DUF72 family)
MIEIGTSGWVYPHWVGRFYPSDLPAREQLSYYAQHFSTVEINRSFYRLPTYEQFRAWAEQTSDHPNFCFAVKASRYITHLKKLHNVEEGLQRLVSSAQGLGTQLGPFLYQLPPHWRANPERLKQFIKLLPSNYQAAFEFRDPTWFQGETLRALSCMLNEAGCALAVGIGGSQPTPTDIAGMGPFRYYRFHHGAHGIGFSDEELIFWAKRFVADIAEGRNVYVYFNNDPEAYAIRDALRLRELLAQVQG